MSIRKPLLAALALALLAHQDVWNWHRLAWLGPLPAGFAYHLACCLGVAVLLAALVATDRRSDRP